MTAWHCHPHNVKISYTKFDNKYCADANDFKLRYNVNMILTSVQTNICKKKKKQVYHNNVILFISIQWLIKNMEKLIKMKFTTVNHNLVGYY